MVVKATFWVRYFFRVFKDIYFFERTIMRELACLFYKSLLLFLTFVNCKGPYRKTSSQNLSMFQYCVCAIRSHPKSKEYVCWNSSCCRVTLNYNSILKDVKYSICSFLDFEYRLRVIMFTQERAPWQTFTYLKWQ